jgi:hypothetical protein
MDLVDRTYSHHMHIKPEPPVCPFLLTNPRS